MLDILCPLICESDMVASELLDIILINIVEPNKSQRRNAYSLAKDLILKCSNTLEPYIQSVCIYFNYIVLN
jgi:sister-chromatid-cohesion protein PDS5